MPATDFLFLWLGSLVLPIGDKCRAAAISKLPSREAWSRHHVTSRHVGGGAPLEAGRRECGEAGGGRRGAAVLGADADAALLRLRAAATAHVACQVHASLHLGHPEPRRKGQLAAVAR